MPLDIHDEIEINEKCRQQRLQEKQERDAEVEEMRTNLQKVAQKDPRPLAAKTFEAHDHYTEYRIEYDYDAKRGPFGIFTKRKTRLVAQVFDFRKETCTKYPFCLAVFDQANIKLAKEIAAFLTLVYHAEKIKLDVSYSPRTWSSFLPYCKDYSE